MTAIAGANNMRITRALLPLLLPVLAACGGVKIILHSPVESRCTSAGLKGCPELTEGVLLYVEGQKDKGKDQLLRGAAENAPEKVHQFAVALRELKNIPGTERYMKPVLEVADILASAKGDGKTAGKGKGKKKGGGGAVVIKDPDVAAYENDDGAGRTQGGVVAPGQARLSCGFPGASTCALVASGPLVITELMVGDGCSNEVVVAAATSPDRITGLRWVVRTPHGLDGERGFVRPGESLYVGIAGGDPRCTLTWAGFRPNGM